MMKWTTWLFAGIAYVITAAVSVLVGVAYGGFF